MIQKMENEKLKMRTSSYTSIYFVLVLYFGLTYSQSDENILIKVEADEEISGRIFLVNVADKANLTTSGLSYEYNILPGDHDGYFVIEPNSDFYLNQKVDREVLCPRQQKCKIAVQIGATAGTVFKILNVEVTIRDKNDNRPSFSDTVVNFSIPEGTPLGTSYELPSAKDLDVGLNSIQQFLLEPEAASFGLEEQKNLDGSISLNLILNLSLDRELWDNYQLYVKAIDGGVPSLTGMLTVNINVTDVNDNRPVFIPQEYNTTIDEDIEVGTGIINVTATDRDIGENARLTYSFTGMEPASIVNSIDIKTDTGEIYLKRKFDSETGPFTLYVEARDNGNPVKKSYQARVTIHMKDKNDNYPIIQRSMLIDNDTVLENTSINTPIAYIRVTDADTGLNGEVECTCNNANFSIVDITTNNFRVDVAVVFDREAMDKYKISINCSDKGVPSLSATEDFEVKIGDINDHVPNFSQSFYATNVSENNLKGAVLLRVTATDLDIGTNAEIRYRILPFNYSSNFSIDQRMGIVKAEGILDRELVDRYEFTVTASNPTSPNVVDNATVIIRILDTNDNAPDFNADSYSMSVMENSPNGTSTGEVRATDHDLGDNSRISYMIGSSSLPFAVLDDGTVVTTQELDREKNANYKFEVIAVDHGDPPRQSSIPVDVIVLDINDNPPYLDFPYGDNDTITVPHTALPNSAITEIIANDLDYKENKRLNYSIIAGNDDNIFRINSATGKIYLNKQILSGDVMKYTLTVLVKDSGEKPLETRATLHVEFYIASGSDESAISSSSSGQKNILIAIVISCVTFVLSVIIIVIICMIRRKDEQKDLYNSKAYDEQRIMPDINRNSNRSSSSRGSHDKMITSESQYMENGIENRKSKKEVSFSLDEEKGGVVSMDTLSNGQFDRVSTFKSPSPVLVENPTYDPVYHKENTSPLRPEDAKQREIHRMTSLRVHQALMQTNNNNKLWSQSSQEEAGKNYHGLGKSHLDDSHSETSGEATASDSGRGGSEEDIRSSVTNSHDTDDSRSPNTSSSHPFYSTEAQKPSFSSFHGNNVHRAGPILSSFTGKPINSRGKEDVYMKNAYPLNDLSKPNRSMDHTHRHSSDVGYQSPNNFSASPYSPVYGLRQSNIDSDQLVDLSMQSNIPNSEIDSVCPDDDDNTTTSGSYTINDIQDDILTAEIKEGNMFYKPDTFV